MSFPNIGFSGAAGSGKTSCVGHLVVNHCYLWNALAHPLKTTVAWDIVEQFELPVLNLPAIYWTDNVRRIKRGYMGVRDIGTLHGERSNATENEAFDDHLYRSDIAARDALLAIERAHKPKLRTIEQLYGTEVVRMIHEELYPGTLDTPDEHWTRILAREFRRNNRRGFPSACDDVRHLHEAETIAETLDAPGIIVRIERDPAMRQAVGIDAINAGHSSEAGWARIPAHYRIQNDADDFDGLHVALDTILEDVRLQRRYGATPTAGLEWPNLMFHDGSVRLTSR